MAAEFSSDDSMKEMLSTWLREKLLQERLELEVRHGLLYENFKSLVDAIEVKPLSARCTQANVSNNKSSTETDSSAPALLQPPDAPSTAPAVFGAKHDLHVHPRNAKSPLLRSSQSHNATSFFGGAVSKTAFEVFFAIVITVNLIVMAFGSQYNGLGVGYKIKYRKFSQPKEEIWPGAHIIFEVFDMSFGVLYTSEIVVKLVTLRLSFFDRWNLFDTAIVLLWFFDRAQYFMLPNMMLFRSLRLLRLLRLIKLARALSGFEGILLLFTAMRDAMTMLAWVLVFMLACQLALALLLNQMFTTFYIESPHIPDSLKSEAFQYFGTFVRSFFSLFELQLGNWVPIGRFFLESVDESVVIVAILYKLTFGFSVVAVVNGCFIKETFKAVENDDFLMIMRKESEDAVHTQKMVLLLEAADSSADGVLSCDEFVAACKNHDIALWLGAQGLAPGDAKTLFTFLDDGSGELTIEELSKGVKSLKGPARSIDLQKEARLAAFREQQLHKELQHIQSMLANMSPAGISVSRINPVSI